MNSFLKSTVVVVVFVLFFCTAEAVQANNWYSSNEECREVYEGGRAFEYVPAPNSGRAQRAIAAGAQRAPLRSNICTEMLVADGRYHSVFVPKGTEMLWKDGQLYGHAVCGNPVRGVLELSMTQAHNGNQALQGYRGEQGPAGRDGRDGTNIVNHYVPLPPSGAMVSSYSGMELTRDLGHDFIWGVVVDRGIDRIADAYESRGRGRVEEEYWRSRRGPSHITVTGNCNGVFGTANCTTNHPVVGVPGHQGPTGPVYTQPGEPITNRPPQYTQPGEPIGGMIGPGYNQPGGPIGGGGLTDPVGGNSPIYTQPGGPSYGGPSDPVCGNPPC